MHQACRRQGCLQDLQPGERGHTKLIRVSCTFVSCLSQAPYCSKPNCHPHPFSALQEHVSQQVCNTCAQDGSSCYSTRFCCQQTQVCGGPTCVLSGFTPAIKAKQPKTCVVNGATVLCDQDIMCDLEGSTCATTGGSTNYCLGRLVCLNLDVCSAINGQACISRADGKGVWELCQEVGWRGACAHESMIACLNHVQAGRSMPIRGAVP